MASSSRANLRLLRNESGNRAQLGYRCASGSYCVALGVGKGDEVITTSNTFFATAEAIWLVGATPVFVDIETKTRNIDVTKIEEKVTPRTKAIIPVHLFGQPAEMPAIRQIADKHNLFVIEDCAQAFGAKGDTWKLGELSDAVCTSFITAKNLGCFGDGGGVITNRTDIVEPILKMRNHGSVKRSVTVLAGTVGLMRSMRPFYR